MADVQLEHGFLRVANALDEALTYAPFKTISQMKIARCIVRMTYGWRQKTVKISVGALAQRCNTAYSGAFRRALDDLIREGVIIQAKRGIGAEAGVYAINKDHETWGHYSVASQMLERLFRQRLPGDDDALTGAAIPLSLLASQGANASDDPSRPSEGDMEDDDQESGQLPSGRRTNLVRDEIVRPLEGDSFRPNSFESDSLRGRKDSVLPLERQTATATAPENVGKVDQNDFAIALVSACNLAVTKRWGERPNPMHYGQAQQLAADLIQEGFTNLEIARSAIDTACTKSRVPDAPGHPSYFRNVIREAHQRAQQIAFDDKQPQKRNGNHCTSPIAHLVDPAAHAREMELEREWNRERRLAAIEWGKDPINAARYHDIVEDANVKIKVDPKVSWTASARDEEIVQQCINAIDFPSFDVWRTERDRTPGDVADVPRGTVETRG